MAEGARAERRTGAPAREEAAGLPTARAGHRAGDRSGYADLLNARRRGLQPVQKAAAPNRTGLPDRLKAGVEVLSGMSMNHVRVYYNSGKPARIGAHAFAQGSDIHVATGQERHLPHEAWHVVQQAQGRVRPTLQLAGGAAINDDPALEREADAVGARIARLSAPAGRGAVALQQAAVGQGIMQRVIFGAGREDLWATKIAGRVAALEGEDPQEAHLKDAIHRLHSIDPIVKVADYEDLVARIERGDFKHLLTESRAEAEPPKYDKHDPIISKLFSLQALNDPQVKDLEDRVLGINFRDWVTKSPAKAGDPPAENGLRGLADAKLAAIREAFPGLYDRLNGEDVIAIFSYTWYADQFMRKAFQQTGWANYGIWEAFARRFQAALRKLPPFTGAKLYRSSRPGPGHEAEKLKSEGDWTAHSFLSTTYTPEASAELAKDAKYTGGAVLEIPGQHVEGYHIEHFSYFSGEHEVVLMPGHKFRYQPPGGGGAPPAVPSLQPPLPSASASSAPAASAPRPNMLVTVQFPAGSPAPQHQRNWTAEFEALHARGPNRITPPPPQPPPHASPSSQVPARPRPAAGAGAGSLGSRYAPPPPY